MKKTKININSSTIVFLKIQIFLSVLKLSIQQSFLNIASYNPLTLFFFIFPITFYYSFDSNPNFFLTLLQQNIPAIHIPFETISAETFQKTSYLPLYNSRVLKNKEKKSSSNFSKDFFSKKVIQSIHFCNESISIQMNLPWNSYQKHYFLGIKHPKSSNLFVIPSRDNIPSPFYQNEKAHGIAFKYQKKWYQIDEFPFKLENKFFDDFSLENGRKSKNNHYQEDYKTKLDLNLKWNKTKPKIYGLTQLKPTSSLNTEEIFTPVSVNNLKSTKILKKLNNFFCNQNYCFSNDIFQKSVKSQRFTSKLSALNSQIILNKINNLEQKSLQDFPLMNNTSFLKFLNLRRMSQFEYPDFTNKEVLKFLQKKDYISKILNKDNFFRQIQIPFGSNISHPVIYNQQKIKKITPLRIKYGPVVLFESLDRLWVYYEGPSVLPSQNPNIFNSCDSINSKSVWNQLVFRFEKKDPRFFDFFRFFGKSLNKSNPNPSLTSNTKTLTRGSFNVEKQKDLHLEKKIQNEFFTYKSRYAVPFLDQKNWHAWFLTNSSPLFQSKTAIICTCPIIKIQSIKNPTILSFSDLLDYQNEELLIKDLKTLSYPIFVENEPRVQSTLKSRIMQKTFVDLDSQKRSTHYQDEKDSSSFTKKFLLKFEKWNPSFQKKSRESFHSKSWLLINQFLLVIFITFILKQMNQEYGKEVVSYVVELMTSLGIFDNSLPDEFLSENSHSGYRLIPKSTKSFRDIAGIDQMFLELSEIVWFLRNPSKSVRSGRIIPKGILLVGFPGTGKTLLVQAIAGEAKVPILIQSTSALDSSEESTPNLLKKVFEKAKILSPCIIFFDEIDSLGSKRSNILENPIGTDGLVGFFAQSKKTSFENAIPFSKIQKTSPPKITGQTNTPEIEDSPEFQKTSQENPQQLGLLMQLLIELDGLQVRRRILVIGATNRPETLDPALTRPGRFDKVFQLGLPAKRKRIEICQLYGQQLGFDSRMFWNDIADQTLGLSGADLAAIMNQSSIHAILNETSHSMQTIEYGIEKVTGYSSEFNSPNEFKRLLIQNPIKKRDPFFIARFAYYHTGQTIIERILPSPLASNFCSLFPNFKNMRYLKVSNFIFKNSLKKARRFELESQLVDLLSGKASELLFLVNASHDQQSFLSNIGFDDLKKASQLIYLMIDQWFFYTKRIVLNQTLNWSENSNFEEILDPKVHEMFNSLIKEIETKGTVTQKSHYRNFQRWSVKPWWQLKMTQEKKIYSSSDWYRILIDNPEEKEFNGDWIPPDFYFHNNDIYFLTKTINYSDLYKNQRDFLYQSIFYSSFLLGLEHLNNVREFLDFLVNYLIHQGYLRQDQIEHLYQQFYGQKKNRTFTEALYPIKSVEELEARFHTQSGKMLIKRK
jgi:ATP-dependent Zn protease